MVADLDRDGRSDVAHLAVRPGSGIYDPACRELRISLTRGDGSVGDAVRIAETGMGGVLVSDFNGDSMPDIAAIDSVFLGAGDGSFTRAEPFFAAPSFDYWYSPPAGPAAAADLNGDGRPDLVYLGTTEGRTILGLVGNGDGTMVPLNPSSYWLHVWESVDRRVAGSADLDVDGRADLVTATYCAAPNARPVPGLSQVCSAASSVTVLLKRE